ncbi:MAG: N-methylhydantoinase, partial [Solirubrobacteraceae bacterium]|nr:N-methylhydantoinase [Solirubrobacteraceae bacterium]
ERTKDEGLPTPAIMQSSGGLADVDVAAGHAAFTVLSGPAGGAAAAALLAERCEEPDLLCFDMGGTSCDVCVVEGGTVRESAGRQVGGRPLALPMVDIHTVGAGGGSIGWRDAGGALRVGPRSAGAEPGPACYGRGGAEPTVTDANLVLGHLDPGEPLAGGVELDAGAARAAVGTLADDLGLSIEDCAAGIVRVANAEMVRAMRVMTVERGVDPRDFALLAFGGAGPLHAAAIADELGMRKILVPRASGVLSALGLAAADRRRDHARTVFLHGDDLTADALAVQDGEAAYDVRYRGQSFELTVRDVEADPAAVREAFETIHEERYGYKDPEGEIEVVTIRERHSEPGPDVEFEGDEGEDVDGPTVVRLPEATLVVPEGWTGTTDRTGTIVLERAS